MSLYSTGMIDSKALPIIYRDAHFVAVNKPPGLLVHRSPIDRREKRFAVQQVRNQIGQPVYPVHRLDRPTSGVLLFALSSQIARKTAELFQEGRVHKRYLAVVRGHTEARGTIDQALKEVRDKRIRRCAWAVENLYPALTDFERLAKVEIPYPVDKFPTSWYSLVALYPRTGRRHQLRRHLRHIGHPIIGDTKYCNSSHNHFFKNSLDCGRLLLAAVAMRFRHPVTGTNIVLNAQLGVRFESILERFEWKPAAFGHGHSERFERPDI